MKYSNCRDFKRLFLLFFLQYVEVHVFELTLLGPIQGLFASRHGLPRNVSLLPEVFCAEGKKVLGVGLNDGLCVLLEHRGELRVHGNLLGRENAVHFHLRGRREDWKGNEGQFSFSFAMMFVVLGRSRVRSEAKSGKSFVI